MKKIAIYCRVSTEEQARNKEGSITSQIQRLQMKVDEKNAVWGKKWGKVARIYKDEAYSGKNTNRPEFQQMMADVRANRIDTVMVTELSRLSRSVTDFLNFIKELEDSGCDFICPQYEFDTTSPAGKVFVTIIMALAQFERELTAERIKNNCHARALRGLLNGGRPVLGYDKDPQNPGGLLVNENEARFVREAFKLYLESDGVAEIVNIFGRRGITNKKWINKSGKNAGGESFTVDSMRRLLTNPIYIGKKEINPKNKDIPIENLKPEEQYKLVDGRWKGIVDKESFSSVQDKMQNNKKMKYKATHDFIFSGLLVCDECGASLSGRSGTGRNKKHFYYGHTKKTACKIQNYNAEELEKQVKKELFDLINCKELRKQFVEILKDQAKEEPGLKKTLLKSKKGEISLLEADIEKLLDIIANNPLAQSLDSLLAKTKEKEKKLKLAKQQLEQWEEDILINVGQENLNPEFVLEGIDKLRKDNFRKAKSSKKKSIVQRVIKSIHIHPDNTIKVDFWENESRSMEDKKLSLGMKGVSIPFHKPGRPLEASFTMGASSRGKLIEIKKNLNLGTRVLWVPLAYWREDSFTCVNGTRKRT